jgi:hypothetical protein
MCRASAVSHQIISSEKPKPVIAAATTTSGSGAPSANARHCTGQASTSSIPARSGRRGRQRMATNAPMTAPTPAHASSSPNTPALP